MLKEVYSVTIWDRKTDAYIDEDFFYTLEEAEQYKKDHEDETCYIEIEKDQRVESFLVSSGYGMGEEYDTIISAAMAVARNYIEDFLYNPDEGIRQYTIEKVEDWA